MKQVIGYFEKYYSCWLRSMTIKEFLLLFKMYQTRIKKLSDMPKQATWFRKNISDNKFYNNNAK